jgi:hypothetical protein
MKAPFLRATLAALLLGALGSVADAGEVEPRLQRLVAMPVSAAKIAKLNRTGLYNLKVRGGQVYVSVILEAQPSAIQPLRALGAQVHSVLSSGIVTADVPVTALPALAARADIGKVEGGRRVRMYNTESNKSPSVGTPLVGMNNPRTSDGAGVIVGVIDSGLDWTHGDFIHDTTGDSRILHYWDQSDTDDSNPPSGFTYGHEYSRANFNDAIKNYDNTWTLDTVTNTSSADAVDDPNYPIKAAARDTNGHGTHVTGSAAGDGSASGEQGAAPGADIIFVKFDFDGSRNSDAAILDGVNYIFQKAAAAGKPCVINMSLGSDFGPHDGSTLEERGIDDLTGPGNVVVVAAGNPGANNWSEPLSWGFAMHGSGEMDVDVIKFRFPDNYDTTHAGGSYVFFDIWYAGGTECQVQIKSPSGALYPPNFSGPNRRTWKTGSAGSGFNTAEGGLLVFNGGDQLGWDTNNGDNELYVEIGDYWDVAPASGEWEIRIIKHKGSNGRFDSWHGTSSNVVRGWRAEPLPRSPTPTFGNQANGFRQSDNVSTIGSPASASKVIAVAAYQARQEWPFYDPQADAPSSSLMAYGLDPITYYDPYGLGELANFSGRGPRRDGVLKPEIAAPGVGTTSSFSHFTRHLEWPNRKTSWANGGPYHFSTQRVSPNLEATTIQGTSMACPNAAGAIALLLEADPTLDDVGLRALFATAARHDVLTDTFQNTPLTAQTDTDANADTNKPNNDWGYGKLDIGLALQAIGTPPPPPPANTAPSACAILQPSAGATVSATVDVVVSAADAEDAAGTLDVQVSTDGGASWQTAAWDGSNYVYAWNTTGSANGSVTLDARATDSGGLAKDASSVTVTVDNPPAAGVSVGSISEPVVAAGQVYNNVTITGTGFQPGASVDLGDKVSAQQVSVNSPTQITLKVRVNNRATSGPRTVTVTNPDGSSGSNAGIFSVQ